MAKKTEKEIVAAEHLAQIEEEEQRLVRTLDNLRRAKEQLRPHGMFKSEQSADRVVLAERVTRRHGEIFAKTFLAISSRTEAPGEAFELSGVMEWPDDVEDESRQSYVTNGSKTRYCGASLMRLKCLSERRLSVSLTM